MNTEGDAAASGSQTTAATLDYAQKSASSSADLSPDSEVSPGDDTMVFQQPGQGSCPPADIGDIFVRAKSSADLCSAVGLTITQKYELLKNHRKPGHQSRVPNTIPWWLQPFFPASVADRASCTVSWLMALSALLVRSSVPTLQEASL